MDTYKQIVTNAFKLIILFVFFNNSHAYPPNDPIRICILVFGSIMLMVSGFEFKKGKKRFRTMFMWCFSFLPWLFYAQTSFIASTKQTSIFKYLTDNIHVLFIYNSTRLVFGTCVFIIIVYEFFKAIKNLYSKD